MFSVMALQSVHVARATDSFILELIRETIAKYKLQGRREVDVLDLYVDTRLPVERISWALEVLRKKGVISDGRSS